MIRRLITLVLAVAGRSKTIQGLVAMVWPSASSSVTKAGTTTPHVVQWSAAPEPAPVAAAPVVPQVAVAAAVRALVAADEDMPAAEIAVEAAPAEAPEVETAPMPVAAAPTPEPESTPVEAAPPAPAVPLRPLGTKEAMDGSVWVPRILWALEYAKLRQLGPLSASDISRVLTEHSGLSVPSPNVARAFRDRKQQGASYWKEVDSQRYEISRAGSVALRKQLRNSDN